MYLARTFQEAALCVMGNGLHVAMQS